MSDKPLKAFARPSCDTKYNSNSSQPGMNLRDWIMGQALAACIAEERLGWAEHGISLEDVDDWRKDAVKEAYKFADIAMKMREE